LELNKDAQLFKVQPGELTRWYIVNPGPNDGVSFHFIGGILSVRDGSNQANNDYGTQDRNDETWWIPPGSASVIEATFPDPGPYVGVDHSMKDVVKGGAFVVVADENSTATDHPPGTWVPPAGSDMVSGEPPSEGAADEGAADEGAVDQGGADEGEDTGDNATDTEE
jgi:nitrite reductase (NO-forming)